MLFYGQIAEYWIDLIKLLLNKIINLNILKFVTSPLSDIKYLNSGFKWDKL